MKGLVGGPLLVGGLGPGPPAPPLKSGPAGQCGCDNVTNMSGPSSATPQGSQSDSLGFAAKVLDAWTNCSPDEVSRDEMARD